MREILGRRRENRSPLLDAALHTATRWGWPVLPGAPLAPPSPSSSARLSERTSTPRVAPAGAPSGAGAGSRADAACSCPDSDCVVPGAHPFDPELLAATTDARMVRWWWTHRPSAPVLLATGGRAPCALSLPAIAGARALAEFDHDGVPVGPVVATPTRFSLLVRPYALPELGELLFARDWVPSSLRFHNEGGYVVLPPSRTGAAAQARWERGPEAAPDTARRKDAADGTGAPWLPHVADLLDVLIEASAAVPDTGSTLAY